jgi:hypothetical protein
MQDQTTTDRALEERAVFVSQLRALADYLERTVDAPLPLAPAFVRHYADAGEGARLALGLGLEEQPAASVGPYVHWSRWFGPIQYGVQAERRADDTILLRALERTLGRPLTTEDRARALGHLDGPDQPLVPDDAPVVGHAMIAGSHERTGGPECRCGAPWSRAADRCTGTTSA